jgi:hypothetical protein|tara:strand:+ start:613 stop:978 length:366 start_codon:yes stop_codon:yes gene_type:complete
MIKSKPRAKDEELLQKAVVDYLLLLESQKKCTFNANYANVARSDAYAARTGKKNRLMGVRRGWPDITVFRFEDKPIFFELKSATGRCSPHQIFWRDRLQAMGFDWFLIRSLDDVKEALGDG